ncbi:hypothetical protein GCM10009759_19280 [Kitasatospora saccharophila]|uniref:Uncharacterized protein n=1 Tax=Kitasatospora saccharophila TaxID=407973 RepID=A0ABP5I4N0_9ACTN
MVTAIVTDANRPIFGSTPAITENEIASGISASATTSPARTSVRHTLGSEHQAGSRKDLDTAEEDKRRQPVRTWGWGRGEWREDPNSTLT